MNLMKAVLIVLALTISACAYVKIALSVDISITAEDEQAIIRLGVEKECENTDRIYVNEVGCLNSIQIAVQSIGEKSCAVAKDIIEPPEFLRRGYGCCFDRARLIEKAARYYGYATRHVFLIQTTKAGFLSNFLPLGQGSHATSEVLTSKGWLGIDSNEPFILMAKDGSPYTYRDAIDNLNEFPTMAPQSFYSKSIDVIYGLYSRHGNFHGRNFPGPEYVFDEVLWNWK